METCTNYRGEVIKEGHEVRVIADYAKALKANPFNSISMNNGFFREGDIKRVDRISGDTTLGPGTWVFLEGSENAIIDGLLQPVYSSHTKTNNKKKLLL